MYNSEMLAERLKRTREQQNLTQRQLAEKSNITAATISAYEKGAKNPTLQNVMQLSEALNVSIDWLCGNDNNNTSLNNYSDIVLNIVRALDGIYYSIEDVTETYTDNGYYTDETYADIRIYDKVLQKFLFDLQKMVKLLNDGTIDRDILNSWIDGQLKKYDKPIKNINTERNEEQDLPF